MVVGLRDQPVISTDCTKIESMVTFSQGDTPQSWAFGPTVIDSFHHRGNVSRKYVRLCEYEKRAGELMVSFLR